MAQITLKNAAGKDAGTVELDDATFGIQPNVPVMHQVVTAQLAARRAGTQATKTRSTVRGGGRKPYRQKGTGNARQGSTRSPQFTGGAVALGPQPRKYNQKTPKKMISLALRSALSDRAAEGKVVVVDSWGWDKPSTKSAAKALAGLGVEGRVLIVVGRDDATAALSFRNMPEVQLIAPGELNAYDVLCNDWVVFTQDLLPTFAGATKSAAAAESAVADSPSVASFADLAADSGATDEASAIVEVDDWEGSAKALADGSMPAGFEIKGNKDSMLYHTPGSRFYKQTEAEVWFDSEESAEAAGFSKPASQLAAEAAAEVTEIEESE
jgi:large subunit ribosomal protein L4